MSDEIQLDNSKIDSQSQKGLGQRWTPGKGFSSWSLQKIARAQQHYADLTSRLGLWAASQPISTEGSISDNRLRWELRLEVRDSAPVLEWSLILGDCLHNLRSALDACVWEFAHIDSSTPSNPRGLQFPILTDAKDWQRARERMLQTVPHEVAERIELIQPFNRPPGEASNDPLICLSELNNLDKHRSSVSVTLEPSQISQNFAMGWESSEAAKRNAPPNVTYHMADLSDGALLVEVSSIDPIKDVHGGFEIGIQLLVDTTQGKQPISLIGNLINYTTQVVQFILNGPATAREIAMTDTSSGPEWIDMHIEQDGRSFRVRPQE